MFKCVAIGCHPQSFVQQVGLLLKSWNLYETFGSIFFEQQIDGDLLSECEEEDFLDEDYPDVTQANWKHFW